jgi:hypothetical protein
MRAGSTGIVWSFIASAKEGSPSTGSTCEAVEPPSQAPSPTPEKVAQVHAALIEQGPERLMLETDCPYLAPIPKRGEENQPAYLGYILQHASALFEMQVQDLEDIIYQSTIDFFRLPQ